MPVCEFDLKSPQRQVAKLYSWWMAAAPCPAPRALARLPRRAVSYIEAACEESDRRIFEVRYPDCCILPPITWAQIQWPEGRRDLARRVCPNCVVHEEHTKPTLLASGRWRATQAGEVKTAGFHLSRLYSSFET